MKKSWLDNKTILITGASSGIGYKLSSILLQKHNCHIIGIGRSKEKMEKVKSELVDNFEYYLLDVSLEDNWKQLFSKLKNVPIDILINNAGILPPFERFEKTINLHKNGNEVINNISFESVDNTLKTNLMSVIYGTSYFMKKIEESSTPAIINIASSAALCPLPGISIYSASKAAVKNFTESLSLEKDYYVGLVCPGFTKTNIFRNQTRSMESKLIKFIQTDLDKMASKIYKGVKKRKKRMVFGMDAKCMDRIYRLMPKSSIKLFTKVLKSAKIDLFEDVFKKENEK